MKAKPKVTAEIHEVVLISIRGEKPPGSRRLREDGDLIRRLLFFMGEEGIVPVQRGTCGGGKYDSYFYQEDAQRIHKWLASEEVSIEGVYTGWEGEGEGEGEEELEEKLTDECVYCKREHAYMSGACSNCGGHVFQHHALELSCLLSEDGYWSQIEWAGSHQEVVSLARRINQLLVDQRFETCNKALGQLNEHRLPCLTPTVLIGLLRYLYPAREFFPEWEKAVERIRKHLKDLPEMPSLMQGLLK